MSDAAYGMHVEIERPQTSSRFWAIPVLGFVVKAIILIPTRHFNCRRHGALDGKDISLFNWHHGRLPAVSSGWRD